MRDYRAYIVGIDGSFNSIIAEFLHNHPDDTTAIEAAKQLVDSHDIELWDRDRFVGRLSPEAK
jgi:oligoribonuclease NrnB/cAMP/cGMP phosphodiesterase (DHH superfamily)